LFCFISFIGVYSPLTDILYKSFILMNPTLTPPCKDKIYPNLLSTFANAETGTDRLALDTMRRRIHVIHHMRRRTHVIRHMRRILALDTMRRRTHVIRHMRRRTHVIRHMRRRTHVIRHMRRRILALDTTLRYFTGFSLPTLLHLLDIPDRQQRQTHLAASRFVKTFGPRTGL
jgi:hypothetical protein